MRLSHNMFSLSIFKTYKNKIDENAKALNNISTGSKLSSAKDNPNKIGKNETLKIQVLTNDAATKNIQNEIDSIKKDINDLGNNTEFNGVKLSVSSTSNLNENPTKTIKAAIGTIDGESMDIPFFDVSAKNLGIGDLDVSNVDASLQSVDKAIQMVSRVRSKYALWNSLNYELVNEY